MRIAFQILGLLLACAAASAATPVPSDAQLEERRADVAELTKSDYAALDRGRMTHVELGSALLGYAKSAGDPVSVYLLRRAALRQYVTGEDVASTAALYDRMVRAGGMEYALSLARFSRTQLNKISFTRKEGAREFLARLAADERRVRAVETARAASEQAADDPSLREKYAVALVLAQDWPQALVQFSRLGGRAGELGLFERRYPRTGVTLLTTADLADRWWSYPEGAHLAPEDAREFRLRAAKWYDLAVTNGVLRGVRRQIAEKRVQEARTK